MATRTTTLSKAATAAVSGESGAPGDPRTGPLSVDALAADTDEVVAIGEEEPAELTASDLFDPAATGRVVMLWVLTPTISAVLSYLVFRFVPGL